MVARLLDFAAADGGYRSVYLHTDPAVPGAEPFWRSLGTVVHDERHDAGGGQGIVHSELPWSGAAGERVTSGGGGVRGGGLLENDCRVIYCSIFPLPLPASCDRPS